VTYSQGEQTSLMGRRNNIEAVRKEGGKETKRKEEEEEVG
jgi:hypothetical protein